MAATQTPTILVTQSMIKDVRKYLVGDMCGLVLQAKYITRTYPYDHEDSPAKKLGRYFEYILTKAIPKSGVIPEADLTATGRKRKAAGKRVGTEDMMAPYQLAHKNAARVLQYFKLMRVKILKANVTLGKDGMEGTIDILASYRNKEVVIDLKYSSLIHDKWDELGWQWTREQKRFHGTQARQYHIITGKPFFFLVVSSTNDKDILFVEVDLDQGDIDQHRMDVDDTRKKMESYHSLGFHARPDIVGCRDCAIRENCRERMDYPKPKRIKLS